MTVLYYLAVLVGRALRWVTADDTPPPHEDDYGGRGW